MSMRQSGSVICRLTGVLLVASEEFLDLVTNFTLGHLDIILGGTIVGHEGQKVVISDIELKPTISTLESPTRTDFSTYQLVFTADDIGDIHVVGGRRQIFQLLASKDVDGGQVDLSVTVLA